MNTYILHLFADWWGFYKWKVLNSWLISEKLQHYYLVIEWSITKFNFFEGVHVHFHSFLSIRGSHRTIFIYQITAFLLCNTSPKRFWKVWKFNRAQIVVQGFLKEKFVLPGAAMPLPPWFQRPWYENVGTREYNFSIVSYIIWNFQNFQDYRKSSNRCDIDNTTSLASIWSAHTVDGHKTASTCTIKIDVQVFLPTILQLY